MNTKCIGITVCVDYAPLLEITLKHNTQTLEHIFVVTKSSDEQTIDTCNSYNNVTCLIYDFKVDVGFIHNHLKRFKSGHMNNSPDMRPEFFQRVIDSANDGGFNKGGGLRLGQEAGRDQYPGHYQIIIDSDIILPQQMNSALDDIELIPGKLYVPTERRDYHSLESYNNQSDYKRMYPNREGWGFFQMYTPVTESDRVYYDDWPAANKTDVWFRDDITKRNHDNIISLCAHVDHLGRVGDSIHYQKYDFIF